MKFDREVLTRTKQFSEDYKRKVFLLWYNKGRLPGAKLLPLMELDEQGYKPTKTTLNVWIRNEFVPHADELDGQVEEQIGAEIVKQKIEMLERHAKLGKDLQDISITRLREIANQEGLSEAGSLRLLEFAVKLERDSKGIPEMIKKVMNLSDDDLLSKIKEIATKSSTLILEQSSNEFEQ